MMFGGAGPGAAAQPGNGQMPLNVPGIQLYSQMIPGMQMQAGFQGQPQANMQQPAMLSMFDPNQQAGSNPAVSYPQGDIGNYALSDSMDLQQRYQRMMLQQLLIQQAQQENPLQNFVGGHNFMGAGDPSAANPFSTLSSLGGAGGMQSFIGGNPALLQGGDPSVGVPNAGYPGLGMDNHMDPSLNLPVAQPMLNAGKGRRKTAKNKRDKNRPKQPLSAYNIFFKDQRAKMLAELQNTPSPEEESSKDKEEDKDKDKDKDKATELEGDGTEKDTTDDKVKKEEEGNEESASKKRPREVPHGKIGFEKMAKTIAKRWKEIEKEDLQHYEAKAQEDQKRYKAELAVYLQKKRDETSAEKEGMMGKKEI